MSDQAALRSIDAPADDWNGGSYAAAAAVMALMGAFFWAIRGTTGFGGETGGILAGFGWALLWCAFSQLAGRAGQRPYARPWIIVAITAGIAFGGFTGYGVYTAWVRGQFYLDYPNLAREVSVWPGYAMLFACGLHWGGNTGCLMAWCAPARRLTGRDWARRIVWGAAGAALAYAAVRLFPQLFLPYYSEGICSVPTYKTCQRALGSVRNIAPHVGLLLGLVGFEARRRDRRAVALILTMALGFAVPFAAGGYWHTMQDSSLRLGWWKNWEMTIGLVGGLAFGLAFWLFNRPAAEGAAPLGSIARAFFRSGLHLSIPSFILLGGAYEGVCNIRGVETTATAHLLLFAVCVGFPPIIRPRRSDGDSGAGARCGVSPGTSAALLGMIVVAGYLVSIPAEWQLATAALVVLYTGYVGASILLASRLWRRRKA